MFDLINKIINEVTYSQIANKQKSITRLFPTFNDRVKAVANYGGADSGVHQKEMIHDPTMKEGADRWVFEISSGTEKGLKYDVIMNILNLEALVKQYATDKRLWNRSGTDVNYNLLANEIFHKMDIQLLCACPADLYFGGHYIRTTNWPKDKNGALYGEGEDKPPVKKNKNEYGAMCKHLQLLFNVLPMWTGTLASYLQDYYSDVVAEVIKKNTVNVKKKKEADVTVDKILNQEQETEEETPNTKNEEE